MVYEGLTNLGFRRPVKQEARGKKGFGVLRI